MPTIIGLDPGTTQSAWVLLIDGTPARFGIIDNQKLLGLLRGDPCFPSAVLVIEQIKNMGMPAGDEVFQTVYWSGQFAEAWARNGGKVERIGRGDVKLHLCGSMRAKDPNIRQAIIDKFGGKEAAVGKKKSKGPLYGISSHCWSALAVGLVWHEQSIAGKINGTDASLYLAPAPHQNGLCSERTRHG